MTSLTYTKLGDICNYKIGDAIDSSSITNTLITITTLLTNQTYRLYGNGTQYATKYNRQVKELIVSYTNVTKNCVFITNEKIFLSNDCVELTIKNNAFMLDYISYYLYLNQNIVYGCINTNNTMNMTNLMNLKIQNISIDTQKAIINYLDNIYKNANISDTNTYMYQFPVFNVMLSGHYSIFDKIIQYQNMLKHFYDEINNIPSQRILAITTIFDKYRFQCVNTLLNTLCTTKLGSSLKTIVKGDNPVIDNNIPPINYHNKSNYNGVDKLFMTNEGNVLFCDRDCYLTDLAFAIIPKNIQKKYLFYYLKHNPTLVKQYMTNTDITKNIKNLCDNMLIPLPSNQIQLQVITQVEGILYGRSVFDKHTESLQEQISNINSIITNIVKSPLSSNVMNIGNITNTLEFGTNMTNIDRYARTPLNITIPYSTQYGIMWCDKSTYNGTFIIFNTVNLTNCYIVNGIFSASDDMIVIGLKTEYQEYIETIWKQIKENFNNSMNKNDIFMTLQNFTVELYSK